MKNVMVCLAALALVAACSKRDNTVGDTAAGSVGSTSAAATPAPPPPAPMMTDANIVAKGLMADSMEIDLAKIAQTKGTNAGVKEFARMMITDHSKDAKDMAALATAKSLAPQAPAGDTTAQAAQSAHQQFTSMAKGKEFDAAYVRAMVAGHQQVLNDVQMAQGHAQTPELKAHLDKLVPVVQKHLERAQALQAKLDSTATKTP